jgi:hypothetical protein
LERKIGRILFNKEYTDHINHDTLDNRRANLRIATNQENSRNRLSRNVPKTSRFKGVSWNARDEKWQVYIGVNGKNKFVGYYDHEEDASSAYETTAKRIFGEFYHSNFKT